jgi:N-ethylmaleimide reductase
MSDSNPHATFGYVVEKLNDYDLAYLHIIEPRVRGIEDVESNEADFTSKDARQLFNGRIVAAGGFTRESAQQILDDGHADLIAFGRLFVSNPDLPERLRTGAPLARYDRSTFYGGNSKGYTDYPALVDEVVAG